MNLKTLFLTTLYVLKCSECSNVQDIGQTGIYIKDYCPKMEHCDEGAHVLCMFYNPDSLMGPRCIQARDVFITDYLAERILDITNAARSKIALGTEVGRNGVKLPRIYGIMKVKWDNELATFAQILANQCYLSEDLCRATRRFPKPGQLVGVVRFNPDWTPLKVQQYPHLNKVGLSVAKINFGIERVFGGWYKSKNGVSKEMIEVYPDFLTNQTSLHVRMYLQLVQPTTTHIGCGMSAYKEYRYHNNKHNRTYSSLQIVCNFSSRNQKGRPVGATSPPQEIGYTIRCGCPKDTEEDIDCLCSWKKPPNDTSSPACDDGNCKPAVVLLPIFTIEDAPPSKLNARLRSNDPDFFPEVIGGNQTGLQDTADIFKDMYIGDNDLVKSTTTIKTTTQKESIEIFNLYHFKENDMKQDATSLKTKQSINKENKTQSPTHARKGKEQEEANRLTQQQREPYKQILANSSSYIIETKESTDPRVLSSDVQEYSELQKDVLVSNTHLSKTPCVNKLDKLCHPNLYHFNITDMRRTDVVPRKDFSNSELLLNSYMAKKTNSQSTIPKTMTSPKIKNKRNKLAGNPIRNNVNDDGNYYTNNKFRNSDIKKKSMKIYDNESDRKIMTLLDNLEQELKYTDLDVKRKEVYDAKLRKIYASLRGNDPVKSVSVKPALPQRIKLRTTYKNDEPSLTNNLILENAEDANYDISDNLQFEIEDKVLSKPYNEYVINSPPTYKRKEYVQVERKKYRPRPVSESYPTVYVNKVRDLLSISLKNRQGYNTVQRLNHNPNPYFQDDTFKRKPNNGVKSFNEIADNYETIAKTEYVDKNKIRRINKNMENHNGQLIENTKNYLPFRRKINDVVITSNIFKPRRKIAGDYDENQKVDKYSLSENRRKFYEEQLANLEITNLPHRRREQHETNGMTKMNRPTYQDDPPIKKHSQTKGQRRPSNQQNRGGMLHRY